MNIVEEAIVFATSAHEGQTRRKSQIPYIVHPMEVASIIATVTDDLKTIAAGILHDTVEDCGVDPEELRAKFGDDVAEIVLGESEEVGLSGSRSDTWLYRKQKSIDDLRATTDKRIKILWLADKLANIRSFHRLYLKDKDKMWEPFHQKDPKVQLWYYKEILDCLSEFKGTLAYTELEEKIKIIFGEYYE